MIDTVLSYRSYLLWYFLLFIFCLSSYLTFASPLQSSDMDYYIQEGSDFSLIFSENFLKNQKRNELYNKLEHTNQIYKKHFPGQLKETPTYIFASPYNQISNAITSSGPFLRVVFFPTGVAQLTRLAIINWLDTVSVHEMTHIYQLGQISNDLIGLRALFKNSELVFVPFPVFLNVNMILPSFFLEGHAALHESLFSPGGRLYSGFTRALVFSQLKHKYTTTEHFIKKYIINVTNHPFSMSEKYSHGAYFFSTIMEKFKLKDINHFFKHHSEHFIFPLSMVSVKSSFKQTFHVSFESFLHRYIYRYLPLAVQQKKSKSKVLFKSFVCPSFGWKDNEVFFLTSDLINTPVLRVFNRTNHKWSSKKKTFSLGKLFKINDQYYVSASHKISPWKRVYGLFSKGMYFFDSKYKSQSVQDINQDNWLSIDTTNNMMTFRLFLNNKFYDTVHSPALFDQKGRIYYFKQFGLWRVMYRDRKALFRFKGFYGKPVGVDSNGEVLFIASSRFGSTVFAWQKNRGIYRVSDSDVIIEATLGKKDHLITCELESNSYVYKMIPKKQLKGQPILYSYPINKKNLPSLNRDIFKNQTVSHLSPPAVTPVRSTASNTFFSPDEGNQLQHQLTLPKGVSRYNAFSRIRFSGLEMGVFYDPVTRYNSLGGMSFRDVLDYNFFNIFYQFSLDHYVISGKYSNHRYLFPWDLKYAYKQGFENFFGERVYSYINELSSSTRIPLLKKGYWFSSFQLKGTLSSLKSELLKNTYYFSFNPFWQIQYRRSYSNFISHQYFYLKLSMEYHATVSLQDSNLLNNVYSFYTFHPGWNFYFTPFINYLSAEKLKSIPFRAFKDLNLVQQPEIDIFFNQQKLYQTNHHFSGGIKIQKVLDWPVYFSRFPLSLMRIAPFTRFKYIEYLDNEENEKRFLLEWAVGADLEILVHHKSPFRLGIYYGMSQPFKPSWILDGLPIPLFALRLHSRI